MADELEKPMNSRSLDLSNNPLRFLIVGLTGSGKTTLLTSLPGKKFVYIFDPNALASLEGHDVDYELFNVDQTDLDISVKTLKAGVGDSGSRRGIEPRTYKYWEEHFERALDTGFFKQYNWICFDSFTMFSQIVMDRVLYLNGRLGKQPEQADWAAQINTITNVFRALTAGNDAGLYCTAHMEMKQNEVTKKVYNQFIMPGQLRTRLPLMFNNVLIAHADSDDKGTYHTLQMQPDKENPVVRTSFKGLSNFEDVTIDDMAHPEKYGLSALLRKAGKLK